MRRMRHVSMRALGACQLWFDGADGKTMFDATSGGSLVASGGTVARWEDKSGNARHGTQATNKPTLTAAGMGGQSALTFGGTHYFDVTAYSLPSSMNLTQVWAFNRATTGIWSLALTCGSVNLHYQQTANAWGSGPSASGAYSDFVARTNTGGMVASVTWSGSSASLRALSQVVSSGSMARSSTSIVNIGKRGGGFTTHHNGLFGEVAFFSEVLSSAVLRRCEHSLARKWRIAL